MQVKRLKDELEISKRSGRAMAAKLEKQQPQTDTPEKTNKPGRRSKKGGEGADDAAKPG